MGGDEKRRSARLSSVEAKRKNSEPIDTAYNQSPKMAKSNNGTKPSLSTVDFTLDELKFYRSALFIDPNGSPTAD